MSVHRMQARRVFALTPRAMATYYWIQDFCKRNERFPKYYEIGEYLNAVKGTGSENRYTQRNNGIRVCRQLERNGFIQRERSKLSLTDKQMNSDTISVNSATN